VKDQAALRERLAVAIKTGEVIRIVYEGGSRPGAIRDVIPRGVTVDELRAHDVTAGIDKTFLLAKIDLTDAPVTTAGGPHSIEAAIGPRILELQALGWHVVLTPTMATLHAPLKNGRPRTAASISLWFEEYKGIIVVDQDANGKPVEQEERWKSRAPYHVSSTRLHTRSFATLWKPVALFLEEARKVSTRAKEGSK
jgi:hypothetical protein